MPDADLTEKYLDIVDWPTVGDEVLYLDATKGRRVIATVLESARHEGDLMLDFGEGRAMAALDVKHGPGVHQWLTYAEVAILVSPHIAATE